MKKLTWTLAATVAALVAAGAAVAHERAGSGVRAVATHFTAAPTEKTTTRTCTEPGGAVWHLTRGVYSGTATGDLAGAITIRTSSTINTSTGLGFTTGKVELRDGAGKLVAHASLDAVNTQNGVLNGFLRGRTTDGRLLANFTAVFNADGSVLGGDLGGSSTGVNSAVVFGGLPNCTMSPAPAATKEPRKHEHRKTEHKKVSAKHGKAAHTTVVEVVVRHR